MNILKATELRPGMEIMLTSKVREIIRIMRNRAGRLVARLSKEGDIIEFNDSDEIKVFGLGK